MPTSIDIAGSNYDFPLQGESYAGWGDDMVAAFTAMAANAQYSGASRPAVVLSRNLFQGTNIASGDQIEFDTQQYAKTLTNSSGTISGLEAGKTYFFLGHPSGQLGTGATVTFQWYIEGALRGQTGRISDSVPNQTTPALSTIYTCTADTTAELRVTAVSGGTFSGWIGGPTGCSIFEV